MKRLGSLILSLAILFTSAGFSAKNAHAEDIPGNLYVNGDFESGTVEPNAFSNSNSSGTLVLSDEQAHSGSYSVKVSGRKSEAELWGQRLTVEKGKTYIFAGYVRLSNNAKNSKVPANIYWFEGSNLIDTLYTQASQPWMNKNDWTFLIEVVIAKENGEVWPELIGWEYTKGLDDYYVDDIYFGEIQANNIEMTSAKKVTIPFEGETRIELTAKALNQFGTEHGTANANYEWSMADTDDVYIENNELVIKSTAKEGKIEVNVKADDEVSYSFEIELIKADILEATNLYVNGNLETGLVEPFTRRGISVVSLDIEDKDAHDGNYSLKISGRESNSSVWGQKITVEKGKTYLLKGYGKLTSDTKNNSVPAEFYWFEGGSLINKHSSPVVYVNKSGWTEVTAVITAKDSGDTWPELIVWEQGKVMDSYLVDDLYIGELVVTKTEINVPTEINIPTSGEVSEELTAKLYNKFGSNQGLDNLKCELSIADGIKGVIIEGNKLITDYRAGADTIKLSLNCVSSYSNETVYGNVFDVKLVPHGDSKIYIENVQLNGTVKLGESLSVSYDYRQVYNEKDASEISWFMSDSYDGEYKVIEGKNEKSLEITADYEGKYIKAGILPKSESGREGELIYSNISCAAMAPEARQVEITGDMYIGNEIKGSYEYFDANLDAERESKFKWLRKKADEKEFSEIPGATNISYILTEEDTDAMIKFSVTPVSENEPYEGLSYESKEFAGPTAPIAKNVKITSKGDVYTASFEYYHPHGIFQGESKTEWYVDGKYYGNENSIVVDKVNKKIELRVTPVAEYAPTDGVTVSVTTTSRKKSSGGGGGGSSSGGGYVRDVNPTNTTPAVNVITISDMDNHWAKETALNIVKKGIMNLDSNNSFNPQNIITRKEMVVYICKALGLEAITYQNEFEDVSSYDDFAEYLQSAVNAGIISKDVNFRPNDNIKRCEFAKIIAVAAEINKISNKNEYQEFGDEEIIPDWSREYIKTVVKTGIMIGNANGTFNPLGNITKAECATVVERIINMKGV